MKKIIGIFGVVLMVLLAVSCASMSLPAPTPEEAKEYEDTLGEVLASAGFGGVFNVINGDDLDGEYEPGDKLGAFTVTEKSHVRIDIDLSGIFEGKQKVTFDIDVAYENRKAKLLQLESRMNSVSIFPLIASALLMALIAIGIVTILGGVMNGI